jgi:hypothetical protein
MPDRRAKRRTDIIAAHNAIKRWILQLGWQSASYVHEPGRGPENGLVGYFGAMLWSGLRIRSLSPTRDYLAA